MPLISICLICGRRRFLATSAPVIVIDVSPMITRNRACFCSTKCDACVTFAFGPLSESSLSVRVGELFRSRLLVRKEL